ncbi:TetR/AcrR family transcriptional regulator [Nocardia sp. NPDC047038]|uniref:TetR/AcrR family transcriptional regulator n=1 Tax=Nocardia sp. NPDC047038 TaxID=3154338 RepID=UPI003405DFAD
MTSATVNYTESTPSTSPADRRALRDLHRRQTRHQALTAATTIFVTRGYHAATMDEIAQCAGYSKPVLYNQFSGKLELYLAVLQNYIDTLVNSVQQALRATGNRNRVSAAVYAYFDFVDDETQGYRLVFDADGSAEPSVQWRVARAVDTCVDAIADVIAHDTELDFHRARLFAASLVGASQFAARYWLTRGRSQPKADAAAAVINLCWGGLAQIPLHTTD